MAESLSPAAMARETSGVVAVAKKLKIKNTKLKTDVHTPSAANGLASGICPNYRVSTSPSNGSIASEPSAGKAIDKIFLSSDSSRPLPAVPSCSCIVVA